jgi:hypothetical protein
MAAELPLPRPARAVDPFNYFQSEVFDTHAEYVNSLGIDYMVLTNNISNWIKLDMARGDILDELSEFLLSSFTTLLDTYEPPDPFRGKILTGLTVTDVLIVKNKLKEKIRPALEELDDLKNTAKYTEFCSNLLGEMTCVEARAILEVLDPDKQCEALVKDKIFCWICGLKLNDAPKPECEHILPISDALLHLNLYQNRSSIEKLNKYDVDILKLEYLWSHQCCNQSKNNLKYIKTIDERYAVNGDTEENDGEDGGIITTIKRIRANKDKGSYDCNTIFRKATDFKHLSLKRISMYIQPIVDTINLHIKYLSDKGMISRQKAFLVYEYLILIRFFSRIPGCTMVEAFKRFYLSEDADSIEEARKEEAKIRAEMIRIKELEQAAKNAAIAARKAKAEEARGAKAKALIEKEINASIALKNAVSGGMTRAERYAQKAENIKKIQESMDSSKAITESAEGMGAEIIGDTMAIQAVIDNIKDVTTMSGGARTYEVLTKTYPSNTAARAARRAALKQILVNNPKGRRDRHLQKEVIELYDTIGAEITSGIDAIEGHDVGLFTDQDVKNIHLLHTISRLETMTQKRYDGQNVQINRMLGRQSGLEKRIGLEALSVKGGGAYPNNEAPVEIDPYAIIQIDFTTEKAFVFLSAYYPVYLRMNNLKHLTADQYMSTPHILRDTLTYFGADPAEYRTLLMNDSHGISTLQPRSRIVTTQSPQNIAKLMTALSRRPQTQFDSKSLLESSLRQGMVSGGKRRTKKRRIVKRRTRKHKKN